MIKTCVNCKNDFKTSDSRQKSCSKVCADVQRRVVQQHVGVIQTPLFESVSLREPVLPDPETLPAAYVKRVHDLWVSLTEDGPKRIA